MFEAVEDGLCIDPPSAHLTQYLSSCYGTKKGLAVWHSDMHHGDHLPLFTSSNFDPFGATKPCAESGSGSRFALLVSFPCRVYIENLIIITANKNPCAFSVTKRPLIKPIHEAKSYLAIRRYVHTCNLSYQSKYQSSNPQTADERNPNLGLPTAAHRILLIV